MLRFKQLNEIINLEENHPINYSGTMRMPHALSGEMYHAHIYTYPTYTDVQQARQRVQQNPDDPELKHQMENLHLFPHLHNGQLIIGERQDRPTIVGFLEHGRQFRDENVPPWAGLVTMRNVVAGIKHFTSMPVKQEAKPGEPHRIWNPSETDDTGRIVHTFDAPTQDRARFGIYKSLVSSLGHRVVNVLEDQMTTKKENPNVRRGMI